MERRNRQIREFLKEREIKKRMAKEWEDDRRRIRDMEDKYKKEINRYRKKDQLIRGYMRSDVSKKIQHLI